MTSSVIWLLFRRIFTSHGFFWCSHVFKSPIISPILRVFYFSFSLSFQCLHWVTGWCWILPMNTKQIIWEHEGEYTYASQGFVLSYLFLHSLASLCFGSARLSCYVSFLFSPSISLSLAQPFISLSLSYVTLLWLQLPCYLLVMFAMFAFQCLGFLKFSYVISQKRNYMKIKTRLPEVVIEEEHSEVQQ